MFKAFRGGRSSPTETGEEGVTGIRDSRSPGAGTGQGRTSGEMCSVQMAPGHVVRGPW